MEMALVIVCCLIIGFGLGLLVRTEPKTSGILHLDLSDPADGPAFFIELYESPYIVAGRKEVIMDVDVINYDSQK